MNAPRNPGRVAGFWYLLLCIIGPLRLMYIPDKLFVHGNAPATVNNIAAHALLFRLGIAGDLTCGVILIFLALAFYRLFKGVDQYLAVLVVILGGVMPAVIERDKFAGASMRPNCNPSRAVASYPLQSKLRRHVFHLQREGPHSFVLAHGGREVTFIGRRGLAGSAGPRFPGASSVIQPDFA